MRTIATGRVAACVLAMTALLTGCGIALGYTLATHRAQAAASNTSSSGRIPFDPRRPEGRVVVDRIGDLSGRLTRLEIEAADLARRLDPTPAPKAGPGVVGAIRQDPRAPQGGPYVPWGDDASTGTSVAGPDPKGPDAIGLAHLETGIDRLETSLDRMADAVADHDLAAMAYPNRSPVRDQLPAISSGFGVRVDPFTGRMARHMGLDIPAAYGTPVLASGGGRVLSAGFRGPYGNAIVIDHGHGLQTLYGHCSKLYVRPGELVMPHQKIAAVGSTGRSTGPHLHFEVIRDGNRVAPGQVLANVLAREST